MRHTINVPLMTSQHIPWEAIGAYLKDQSDKENEAVVKGWLKASPENIRLFQEIIDTQKLTGKSPLFYTPQKEALWEELLKRISPVASKKKLTRAFWVRSVAVAAALVAAFLIGNWYSPEHELLSHPVTYSRIMTPPGQKTQIILPDSTMVWLNSGSELSYPVPFENGKTREVTIHGECYFDVAKNLDHPFIVHTSSIHIKVFGTRFNVKEDNKKQSSTVTLMEGKVEVLNQENKSISFLEPNQQLLIKPEGAFLQQKNNAETLIAWTNGMLIFDNQAFEEVIDYLESWYGVNIHLDGALHNSHNYTFKVKTESLREVLELISVITPIYYQINGKEVTIKTKDM